MFTEFVVITQSTFVQIINHWKYVHQKKLQNMKTNTKKPVQEKEFDTVKTFRVIKDKISLEMKNMNFEQIKEYLKTNSAKLYTK